MCDYTRSGHCMVCDKQNMIEGEYIAGSKRFRVVLRSGGFSDFLTCDECELQPSNLPGTFRRAIRGAAVEIEKSREASLLRDPMTPERQQAMNDWLHVFASDIPVGILKSESLNGE